ncbi:hypothetical protein C8J56DRAFT_902545 [Mycena floridula]|nr:hypothetical protein C8J56DRAFT_902545 [Mycena floridula]
MPGLVIIDESSEVESNKTSMATGPLTLPMAGPTNEPRSNGHILFCYTMAAALRAGQISVALAPGETIPEFMERTWANFTAEKRAEFDHVASTEYREQRAKRRTSMTPAQSQKGETPVASLPFPIEVQPSNTPSVSQSRSTLVSRTSRDRMQATHPYRSVAPPADAISGKWYYAGDYESDIPFLVQDYYLPIARMRSLIDIPPPTLYDPKIFERPSSLDRPGPTDNELWLMVSRQRRYMHDYNYTAPDHVEPDDRVDYYAERVRG